ncbi:hypothetical protein Nepgr_033046 [Nepenthes gracilis]|uniref:Uncharacterized protein n=1 Tax=Nepenthes gracilis TaxID=150966 RepID=A0AAD3TJU1_NEPGR|nr:hypothetical protein Nepgr_033046 [Nepenthes gracilis]
MPRISMEEAITVVAFVSVFLLLKLPMEKIDGNPVPTVIFKDRPPHFHAFVLLLVFSFSGGLMAISLRPLYPKIAVYCRYMAVLSITGAASIFSGLAIVGLLAPRLASP